MKILLITQWFKPVKGAAAKRTGKMADFLSLAGHSVTVLTSFPTYPTGIIPQEYRGKLWNRKKEENIDVVRVREITASSSDSTLKRLFNMLSFVKMAYWFAFFHKPYDAVIVSSPSFLSGIPGLMAARGRYSRFYFDIRDLWPDSAIELGVLHKNGFVTKIMLKLEKKFYKKANKIFTATPGIKNHLLAEQIPTQKLELLLNSVDTGLFKPEKPEFSKYGFNEGDFICGYIGNHSRVYDLETVINSAQITKNNEKIKYLLIGEGESKKKLQDSVKKLQLNNVIFMDEQSLEDLPPITNLFSLGLVPIANIGVSQESMPSKTSEYFACGKPVLASLGGDMAKIIKEHEVGQIYTPGDAEGLAKAITSFYANHELIQRMGQNARLLALKMFSDQIFQEKLVATIKNNE